MEVGDLIAGGGASAPLQEVGKETVIAKPLAAVVQRHEKEILSFQGFQHLLAVLPSR